ncbi:unnamed protein product [Parascedosporium putredinis]|uniref:NADP-dependent oxidoreductase domain-containing protein n=1 Tax=Parascedosporium putredinis TaxID=1442378 RepID=A0A9P1M9B4_9PEZI|nr:unnamed protein product [Parascedosporium putredinis]CAI7990506.1 unnamed protein product [Parascedosporium putredinis]
MSASKIPTVKLNDGHEIPALAYGLGTARATRGGPRDESLIELTKRPSRPVSSTSTELKCTATKQNSAKPFANPASPLLPLRHNQILLLRQPSLPDFFRVPRQARPRLRRPLPHPPPLLRRRLRHQARPYDPAKLRATWADLQSLKADGKARSIGVSNFLREHLEVLVAAGGVIPAVNQIEFHPYLQHGDLLDFHRQHSITTSAYGPLTPIVRNVGLRWVIDSGVVAITTSSKEERLRNYIEKVPSFKLTDEEVKGIAEAGRQKHYRAFFLNRYTEDDRS